MTDKEFRQGLAILQGGCGKNYREATVPVWWEALQGEYAGAYLSVCRELAKTEERLPSLSTVCDRLNEIKRQNYANAQQERDRSYLEEQEARAKEAEAVVGQTFKFFLDANGGDHPLASYYFGREYWAKVKPGRYEAAYDRLIDQRERFLADPKRAREEAAKQKKKDQAERMEIGRAMDAAAGYYDTAPAAVETRHTNPKAPEVGISGTEQTTGASLCEASAPPEEKEPEFDEESLPF